MTYKDIADCPVKVIWTFNSHKIPGMLVKGYDNFLYVIHNDPSLNGFDAGEKIKEKYGYSYSWQFGNYLPKEEYHFFKNGLEPEEVQDLSFKTFKRFSL